MLTLRPQAPPSRPPDHTMYQRRGRSRQVSHTALARQASEERQATVSGLQGKLYLRAIQVERRPVSSDKKHEFVPEGPAVPSESANSASNKPTFLPLPSLSPPSTSLTPDYYDSPPSPPQSLVDQVHVAYALDDIHLAKVLLLKLKGIEVTSDDDPRIAAVQDEDFDFCFVPHGRLMDEDDEKALLEQQRKEMEKLEEKRRAERLRACERIWEQEKRRLREAKALALRRKEAEEKRKAEEAALTRAAKEKEEMVEADRVAERRARMSRPLVAPPTRNVVSYDALGKSRIESSHATSPSSSSSAAVAGTSVSSRVEEPFVYEFMVTPRRTTPRSCPVSQSFSSKSLSSQSLTQLSVQTIARPTYDESRCIPFSDVLTSMQGPLFVAEHRNVSSSHSKSKSLTRRTSELLDCLLKVVEWGQGERRQRKGKAVDRPFIQRRGSDKSVLQSPCAACSSPTSPASTSSSWLSSPTSSRRSWLSFGSTTSSASTAATTPSTSPIPTWLSKPLSTSPLPLAVPTTRPRPMSILLPPRSLAQPEPHSCKPYAHLTPIPIEEAPLSISGASKRASNFSSSGKSRSRPGSHRKERSTTPPGGRVMRRVSQFVELAKGFQNAYMNATLFSISASPDPFEDRDIHTAFIVSVSEGWHVRNRGPQATSRRLKPSGSRARPVDVSIFLNPPSGYTSEPSSQFLLAPPIPLRPRSSPSNNPPRTVLPNPLPYPVVFKPLPVPCRSPFRLHTHIHLSHHMPAHGYNPTPSPWVSDHQSGAGGYGGAITWRVRTVENPAFLRLKALQNIMWDRGTNWQGRAREGSLGAGKEKVLKVAFEGVGRSWLGVDDWQEAGRW